MPPMQHKLNRFQTPAKLRDIAAELYRQKRFDEALETLNSALSCRHNELDLGLLDLRAATQCKLAAYKAALSDTRQMMENWKANAMGYIRAGKILLHMDNQTALALKIYQRGLNYVPITDTRYNTLRNAHQKLSNQSGRDFLAILPVEVLEMIFAYLTFGQLCRCINVSKQWRRFLISWPTLWLDIDLSTTTKPVAATSVYNYLQYSQLKASRVVLKAVDLQKSKILSNITSRCKNLLTLELLTGGFLGEGLRKAVIQPSSLQKLRLDSQIPIDGNTLRQVMQSCPCLVDVAFDMVRTPSSDFSAGIDLQWDRGDFPNLKSFSLSWMRGSWPLGNILSIDCLCPPASNLTTLKLMRLDNCDHRSDLQLDFESLIQCRPNLEELELSGLYPTEDFQNAIVLPRKLRRFKFHRNYERSMAWDRLLSENAGSPALEALEINVRGDRRVPAATICNFLCCSDSSESPTCLKSLIVDLEFTSYDGILSLIEHPRLEDVEHLKLRSSNYHGDMVAQAIAARLQKLRFLDVSDTRMTGVGIKALVQSIGSLKFLNVNLCPDVGVDAIEWARKKGVIVSNILR